MAESQPPPDASAEPPLGTPPPDARVPAGTSGGPLEAGAPSPAAEQPPPAPAAHWVGEVRRIIRMIEGPGGELVEQEVEHQPAEYVQGVPARDLSQEEYDALADEQRQVVATSGLYALAGAAPQGEPAPTAQPSAPTTPTTEGA
jgi:hypothetical protein